MPHSITTLLNITIPLTCTSAWWLYSTMKIMKTLSFPCQSSPSSLKDKHTNAPQHHNTLLHNTLYHNTTLDTPYLHESLVALQHEHSHLPGQLCPVIYLRSEVVVAFGQVKVL
jgi:hypothetical protein